jgi:hypothetical protein
MSNENYGAGNETRTRDPDLGKVVLYQLSYSRIPSESANCKSAGGEVKATLPLRGNKSSVRRYLGRTKHRC